MRKNKELSSITGFADCDGGYGFGFKLGINVHPVDGAHGLTEIVIIPDEKTGCNLDVIIDSKKDSSFSVSESLAIEFRGEAERIGVYKAARAICKLIECFDPSITQLQG